jgi:hypothetical protein
MRSHTGTSSDHKRTHGEVYVSTFKAPGCAAGEITEREYEIDIPKNMPPSVNANLIQVSYMLGAFVKHDAWNEFGEGNRKFIHINVFQAPENLVQQNQVQAPVGWNPTM